MTAESAAPSRFRTQLHPRQIKSHLDQFLIGQDRAKVVVSVAVFNHYQRVQVFDDRKERLQREFETRLRNDLAASEAAASGHAVEHERLSFQEHADASTDVSKLHKSNVLLLGPTGSGKTLMMQTVAKFVGVPFTIVDCTSLTQAGYVGEDVDICIRRLLENSDYDVQKAEFGIVVLDECDKLAKPMRSGPFFSKDVAGEGVQQSLLQMIEGADITVKKSNAPAGLTSRETFTVNTENILFIFSGAFVGLEKIITERLKRKGSFESFGFRSNKQGLEEQTDIKNFFTPSNTHPLNLLENEDLVAFGLIPELVGRIPNVSPLLPLTEQDMARIITEPKNAILRQYQQSFKMFGVELKFTDRAIGWLAKMALKQGTGARGLKGVMARLLLDVNYELPESSTKYVLITEDVVKTFKMINDDEKVKPFYYSRGQRLKFLDHLASERLQHEIKPNLIEEPVVVEELVKKRVRSVN
ncbi:P-loop containing nucleoside triphosphate hydrolase protein [Lipomyces japonicus]|uniref:P-loop containing nucleoside triphosphate hydrolase protein n=1 Tax=Lipomyces japonicus TaxID=56871 RepID=UPI0034CD7325